MGTEAPRDAELVRRVAAAAGDRDAEAELCRRYAPRVRLYGLKHLRDEDRARDLVQVVLLAVLEALRAGRIEEPEHIDRFVLGTCRHLASRARRTDARLQPTDDLEIAGTTPTFEALDMAALLACFGALDLRARTILHLSFYRDKSADEIAGLLETTAGNVRVVRHRAMARLRDCMGGAA